VRREARGRARERGELRGLRHGQPLDRLPIIGRGRLRHAISAAAEVDLVQIQLEDLVLVERPLDARRERRVLQLAKDAALRSQEQVLRELLRDRAAALHDSARAQVRERGARQRDRVHAQVVVEAVVFRGEKRVAHGLRDLAQRDELAALLDERADRLAVAIEHDARQRRPIAREISDVGQHEPERGERGDHERTRAEREGVTTDESGEPCAHRGGARE
jgi:hypothetical protein